MNQLNYYDADEIFALNPDMIVKVDYMYEFFPVITIDNFYLHPEKVRDLAFQIPITKGRLTDKSSGYPGKRLTLDGFITSDIFKSKLFEIYTDSVKVIKNIEISSNLVFNIFDTSEPTGINHYSLPHTDPVEFAGLVYLNTEDEPVPGTYLYNYKPSGLPMIPTTYAQMELLIKHMNRTNPGKFKDKVETITHIKKIINEYHSDMRVKTETTNNHILDDNSDWEIHTKTEPKYNRFMSYMGGMFHSAAIDYDYFTDKDYVRLNQVLFNNEKRDIG